MTKTTQHPSLLEIDKTLLIFRTDQGVKLVNPKNVQTCTNKTVFNTGYSVASLADLPFNFYFLNLKGETLHMNQQCIEICGFQSLHHSRGKSLLDVSKKASAIQLISNCNEVIAENKIKIFEEQNIRKDGVTLQFLSIKSPCYNDEDKLIGIFGCSIVQGKHSLAESLQQISQLGLLNSTGISVSNTVVANTINENETLSERENLCLFHLCKGYTIKEISKIIGLSPKTIETYLNRAKIKFNCKNKAALIAAYLKNSP